MTTNPLLKSIAGLVKLRPPQEPVDALEASPLVPLGKVAELTGHSDGMVRDNHPQVPVFYDIVPLGAAETAAKAPARKKAARKKATRKKATRKKAARNKAAKKKTSGKKAKKKR
jgi:hypothetical protein